jgi:hypothetical protein
MDKQVYFDYLVSLRDSGVINMLAAGPYLQREFGLIKREASDILFEWMVTFKVQA